MAARRVARFAFRGLPWARRALGGLLEDTSPRVPGRSDSRRPACRSPDRIDATPWAHHAARMGTAGRHRGLNLPPGCTHPGDTRSCVAAFLDRWKRHLRSLLSLRRRNGAADCAFVSPDTPQGGDRQVPRCRAGPPWRATGKPVDVASAGAPSDTHPPARRPGHPTQATTCALHVAPTCMQERHVAACRRHAARICRF